MGQKKLKRFAEILEFRNVLQYPTDMPGNWKNFFLNTNPITLELACGKGEYAVNLAIMHPQKNFIGVDIKGNRLWAGAKKAIQNNLSNVCFLRTEIDKLSNYFEPGEVNEIWITFPDPQLRWSHVKKRLTHPKFLRIYDQVLAKGGRIHLKTDSPDLYEFTKTVIELYGISLHEDFNDVYRNTTLSEELKIKTHYEGLDIANSQRVFYLCFSLPETIPEPDLDIQLKQMIKANNEEII